MPPVEHDRGQFLLSGVCQAGVDGFGYDLVEASFADFWFAPLFSLIWRKLVEECAVHSFDPRFVDRFSDDGACSRKPRTSDSSEGSEDCAI